MKKRIRNFRVYAEMECSAFILTPQAVRARRLLSGLLARRLTRIPRPPDASLTCGWVRKNGEADNVQTDSPHSASRASRKAPHPLLRFSSQNRNDVSVLKGRAAKRTSPRVYTGTASEAARCAPFPRQARKLRMVQTTLSCRCAAIHLVCSRLLPDPPESLRWIPSEMRGRERARSDAVTKKNT